MENEYLVRFANESYYQTRLKIDPSKVKDPLELREEVFFTIGDLRMSVKKEDWKKLTNKGVENKI
jgi:hypothetical protein